MKKSTLTLEADTQTGAAGKYRTVFTTRHGRVVYLSLTLQEHTCTVEDCFYADRPWSQAGEERPRARPKKLKTRVFPKDKLLWVMRTELDKTFYSVEVTSSDTASLPLEAYLWQKLHQIHPKYRFLILVGQGERWEGLPTQLRTRLKNQLHRSVYLELMYYKEGQGVVKQCCYYDRQYGQRGAPATPPMLVHCFFPYTKEGILHLVNQEICCDFTHMLVTEGIDLDSNTAPLCGAI